VQEIVVGVDPHKQTHTAVAVRSATGAPLAERTVPATPAGYVELCAWANALDGAVLWAVEDCRHVSGGLERWLVEAEQDVVRVAPRLMAAQRRSGRVPGKSDPVDALAVARAVLRHDAGPAPAVSCPAAQEIGLLLAHREDLVAERTRNQNRLRWHLHDLGLEGGLAAGALDRACWVERIAGRLRRAEPSPRVRVARDVLALIRDANRRVAALDRELEPLVRAHAAPLLAISGCGPLTAAKLLAETDGIGRIPSPAAFARLAGVAPIDVSSGRQQRHRLNPFGNRQLNLALHRIAVNQGRLHDDARAYLARKQAEGKSRKEALRCLKRQLVRTVYHALQQTLQPLPRTADTTPSLT
jgi:transposase